MGTRLVNQTALYCQPWVEGFPKRSLAWISPADGILRAEGLHLDDVASSTTYQLDRNRHALSNSTYITCLNTRLDFIVKCLQKNALYHTSKLLLEHSYLMRAHALSVP